MGWIFQSGEPWLWFNSFRLDFTEFNLDLQEFLVGEHAVELTKSHDSTEAVENTKLMDTCLIFFVQA